MTNDNPTMTDAADARPPSDDEVLRAWTSDLMDGRLSARELADGLARPGAAQTVAAHWHAYHLIGDALRASDLALSPARDRALLGAVRDRLASEPVVVAPAAAAASARADRPRRSAMALAWPVAAAAGVVAVVGALVALPQAGPAPAGPALAQVEPARNASRPAQAPAGAAMVRASSTAAQADLLRDARVDEYLRAHRESTYGAALMLPAGLVRQVDFGPAPR